MMILYGYLTAVLCAATAFALAAISYKVTGNNEASRKIVHIAAGSGWLVYYFFFGNTVHTVLFSAICVCAAILIKTKKMNFLERSNDDNGLILFTSSMLVMSILSCVYQRYFTSFGLGIFALSYGDGMACVIGRRSKKQIKIYKNKTVAGTAACVVFSFCAFAALKLICKIPINYFQVAVLSLLTGAAEVFGGKYDNIVIPFSVFFVSHMLIFG